MGTLRLPDGTVYNVGDAMRARVEKDQAITALEMQAHAWERRALEGRYTLSEEVRQYMQTKADDARAEARRLRGEPVPEPEARSSRTVSVSLGPGI